MPKNSKLLQSVEPPVDRAMVFVCEKCGKRADAAKNPSHQLASQIKRLAKRELDKHDVRAVVTSCMKLCPEDRIAVAVVPTAGDAAAVFFEAAFDDIDAAASAVVEAIGRTAARREVLPA